MMESFTPHINNETAIEPDEIRLLAEACSTSSQRLAPPCYSYHSNSIMLYLI